MNSRAFHPQIPAVALRRLCALYRILEDLAAGGRARATSAELAERLGANSASLRRDIGHLGDPGPSPSGYDVSRLKALIEKGVGLGRAVRVCVVGLNWLGRALLTEGIRETGGFVVVAGFDANTNRRETTSSPVPLYPSDEIAEVVRRERAEIAVVAAPGAQAGDVIDALVRGGIKGILNLSGHPLRAAGRPCSHVALPDELHFLSAKVHLDKGEPA